MDTVTGAMEAGEAQATLKAIGSRQRGSATTYYLLIYGLIATGVAIGFALRWAINVAAMQEIVNPTLAAALGAMAGAWTYVALCRPLLIKRFRASMIKRGLDVRFTQTLSFADETVVLDSGRVSRTAPWSAVTEIFKAKHYWIFMVQMEPWFVPVRFFPEQAAEKAFIAAALSHLSDGARARSVDAVRFAGA